MTQNDQELIADEVRVSAISAAYTMYTNLLPQNKRPIERDIFFDEFVKNYEKFHRIHVDKVYGNDK